MLLSKYFKDKDSRFSYFIFEKKTFSHRIKVLTATKTLESPGEVGAAETGAGRRAGRDKLSTRRVARSALAKFKKRETQEVLGATRISVRNVEKAQIEG